MVRPPVSLPSSPDDYLAWVGERCDQDLARARELFDQLRDSPESGEGPLRTWNDAHVHLSNVLSLTSLMASVHPVELVRERAERAEQDANRLVTEVGLDRRLFDVLAAVEAEALDPVARRALSMSLRDFRRAGVDRDEETRARLQALAERITEVSQLFSRNIRDGSRSIKVAPEALAGLPEDYRDGHPAEEDGLVTIRTDYPDFVPLMTFAEDRAVRAAMIRAYLDRAWPENHDVLAELLRLRRERAGLLGYADWPSYDAETKMIAKGPAIIEFIDRITEIAAESAARDYAILLGRLQEDHPELEAVDATDKAYCIELVRKERFDVDAQAVRQYFDFAKVRAGLLAVTGRLFDLSYVEVPDAPVWHEDVVTYDVLADGERLGRIYLDLQPRPGKYSHAAQFDLVQGVAGRQLPEGVLVCNFPRGLMEHDDVVTLFHEFGHLLHHVLAGHHEWVRFAGVSTEWDFVEAPSQMLEEWAWDADVLQTFATDAAGQPIPKELVDRMRTANEFGKGTTARTQMFYAAMSYSLHHDVPDDIVSAVVDLQRRYDMFEPIPGSHLHAGFDHLGGYSSAYYTYMWSLVIAKDLFSAFDREDLFAEEVAHRYRDRVLAQGGTKDAADLVADFLGRPYSFDAFEEWLSN